MASTSSLPPHRRKVVVLVSGTGTLLQAIMDHQDDFYEVVQVVSDVYCPAIERAQAAGIPTEVVEMTPDRSAWNERLADAVAKPQPDLVCSSGFMKILGPGFLKRFEGKAINTHPALLPAFPGAHAVRDALARGVKVTGATVHFIDSGVDTGPIIAQRPVLVEDGDTEESLHEKIKVVERELIVEVLRSI